jgi:hypothetical protein
MNQIPTTQIAPSQVAPSQIAPSQIAPSQVAPSQIPTTYSASSANLTPATTKRKRGRPVGSKNKRKNS